jgi:predicted ATPase
MLTQIQLSRFRGFAQLETPCGAITAIVGKNSSGKTSLLHAIRLVCDVFGLALADPETRPKEVQHEGSSWIEVCSDLVVADLTRLFSLADWRQLFVDAAADPDTTIRVDLRFADDDPIERAELVIVSSLNEKLKFGLRVRSQRLSEAVAELKPSSPLRTTRLRDGLQRIAPRAVFVPPFYGVTRVEEYRTLPVVDRTLSSGDQSHIVRNLIARLDGGALVRLNALLGRTVGANLVQRTTQADAETRADLLVTYRDTNGELELSSAGAGLISLVALYAAMERVRGERQTGSEGTIMFLLDEPEAHLHPRLQGQIGEEFARIAVDFGVQLILATHSVEMINRLGLRPDAVLVSIDRASGSAVTLRSESEVVSALDEFCDLTPFTSLTFLASRRILFHEGVTDYRLLDALARVYYLKNDGALARWRRYVPVALDGVGNVSARGALKRVLTPTLFPRLGQGEPVRAALAHDRDYEQRSQPATVEVIDGNFEAITAVWSRNCIESLFLDREVLVAWLGPTLRLDADRLRPLVQQAIAAANADRSLEDAAVDGLVPVLRRPSRSDEDPGAKGTQTTERKALEQARAAARGEPAVWQPGKRRASVILGHIRAGLSKPHKSRLRGSIVDIIVNADANQLGDASVLIPAEVRDFLDLLVGARPEPLTGL